MQGSALRPVLRLLHGNLVDVRERAGTRGPIDGPHGYVLDLLLGLGQLLFEGRDPGRAAGQGLLQRLDAQSGDPGLGFRVLSEQQYIYVRVLISCFGLGGKPGVRPGRRRTMLSWVSHRPLVDDNRVLGAGGAAELLETAAPHQTMCGLVLAADTANQRECHAVRTGLSSDRGDGLGGEALPAPDRIDGDGQLEAAPPDGPQAE